MKQNEYHRDESAKGEPTVQHYHANTVLQCEETSITTTSLRSASLLYSITTRANEYHRDESAQGEPKTTRKREPLK